LEDVDTDKSIVKLNRPIIAQNRAVGDFVNVLYELLSYTYKHEAGSVVTSPLTTIYCNEGDKHIAYINTTNYVIVPLYEVSIDDESIEETQDVKSKREIKSLYTQYINDVYDSWNDTILEVQRATQENAEKNK
jgi:hypothetical protein